jgi:hypothetical protein
MRFHASCEPRVASDTILKVPYPLSSIAVRLAQNQHFTDRGHFFDHVATRCRLSENLADLVLVGHRGQLVVVALVGLFVPGSGLRALCRQQPNSQNPHHRIPGAENIACITRQREPFPHRLDVRVGEAAYSLQELFVPGLQGIVGVDCGGKIRCAMLARAWRSGNGPTTMVGGQGVGVAPGAQEARGVGAGPREWPRPAVDEESWAGLRSHSDLAASASYLNPCAAAEPGNAPRLLWSQSPQVPGRIR